MHFMRKKTHVSCVNKTCLSRGGCWQKEPLAQRLCRTRGEGSPHHTCEFLCWEPSEACSVSGSSVLCLSQLSGSPQALRPAGAGGEQPLPAAVCCRPLRCHVLGWSCHQHPVWPHCASTQGRGEPHPPAGFCQSKISPVGGTAMANGGLFLGDSSSSSRRGVLSPASLF